MSDVDEDDLRQYLPASFGRQGRDVDAEALLEKARRPGFDGGKQNNETTSRRSDGERDDKDDNDDDDDDDDGYSDDSDEEEYPISHEMVIKTHDRAVTSLSLDPSGNRLITGSLDCTMKLHDFGSMTPSTIRAFKTVDPTANKSTTQVETHPVHQVLFNPISPSQVLVVSAAPQAKIFDRNGEPWATFVKGDMYLRDLHITKGHVAEVTAGTWHPTNPNLLATCAYDGTVRVWDVENAREQRHVIVHKSKAAGSGGRTKMTNVAWASPLQGGPNVLVASALDGSLTMWTGEGPYNRPAGEVKDAHTAGTWTGGLDISHDGRLVVTRGGDDTIKLWDLRKFKSPVNTTTHRSTSMQFPTSNIQFSPNSASVLTGSEDGSLHILNPATLRPEVITAVTPGSTLISVLWHQKLNQIITGSANGEVHVLFSPSLSENGAKSVMSRVSKRRHVDDDPNLTMDLSQGLIADGSGNLMSATGGVSARRPNTGMTASGKSRDPRRPHIPSQTPFAKTQPDEEFVKNNISLSSMRDEDPREALLKYAEKAKNDPLFTNAWKETQPTTIYADLSDEEGDEEDGPNAKRIKR